MRCPHCNTEVARGDQTCPECGARLPTAQTESGGRRWLVLIAILAVLFTCCAIGGTILVLLTRGRPPSTAQASPTPTYSPIPTHSPSPISSPSPTSLPEATPPALWTEYQSQDLGVSLSYPAEWLFAEDASLRQVVFASEQADLRVIEFLSGTSLAVFVSPADEWGVETAEQVLQQTGQTLSQTFTAVQLGEIQPYTIGGQDGKWMTIKGEFGPEVQLEGWLAAVVAYGHVYTFAGAAPLDEWPEYQPTLQAMLDSVELSPPAAAPPVPSPTALATSTPTAMATPPPTVPGADSYEPDDTIAEAAPIATDGRPQDHDLHMEGDRDHVCFEATRGRAYTIQTQNLGSEIDSIIHLYDSEGQELARNDDGTEEPLASRIVWVAPSSGRYCVMIRDLAEDSSGRGAAYSISVTESPFAEGADLYEPDDTPNEASLFDAGDLPQVHTFHTSTDADYVSFIAQEGTEYRVQTGSLQGNCDTSLFLYDEDGVELDYDDDGGEESLASLIVWTATSSGVHYVKTSDFSGRAGPTVSYEIWISSQ
jgi:hypothetical protein